MRAACTPPRVISAKSCATVAYGMGRPGGGVARPRRSPVEACAGPRRRPAGRERAAGTGPAQIGLEASRQGNTGLPPELRVLARAAGGRVPRSVSALAAPDDEHPADQQLDVLAQAGVLYVLALDGHALGEVDAPRDHPRGRLRACRHARRRGPDLASECDRSGTGYADEARASPPISPPASTWRCCRPTSAMRMSGSTRSPPTSR